MRPKKAISHPELQAASTFASKVGSTPDQHKIADASIEQLEDRAGGPAARGLAAPHVVVPE
jgi:hypothetical protein